MIRAGFLSAEDRGDLIGLARDGSAAHRLGRLANAIVLLDSGWSCRQVADALTAAAARSALVAWDCGDIAALDPRDRPFIERTFGICYESCSGLIALLHRLDLEYRKPEAIGLDAAKSGSFCCRLRGPVEQPCPRPSGPVR